MDDEGEEDPFDCRAKGSPSPSPHPSPNAFHYGG